MAPNVMSPGTSKFDTNQVSKQTFGYDNSVPFNNQNNVKEYLWERTNGRLGISNGEY